MRVIKNPTSQIQEGLIHFLFTVIIWNSSAILVQAIERLTDGDTFRNPSPSCEVSGCQTFNSTNIGGYCTADCCTCKCSVGTGATYIEHKKQCVKDTDIFGILSIDKKGKWSLLLSESLRRRTLVRNVSLLSIFLRCR